MENKIGSVIRLNRLYQNLSVRTLAEIIGIEYSQLSRIERGLESTNDFIMDSIFLSLELDRVKVEAFLEKDAQLFETLYKDILFRKDKEVIKETLVKYNELVEDTCFTIKNLIINVMYKLLWNDGLENIDILLKYFKDMISVLPVRYNQIYYQFEGFYCFTKGKIILALQSLDKALGFKSDEHTSGFVLYIKGQALGKYGDYFEAYECLTESRRIFDKYHNFMRSAQCDASIANLFLLTGKYERAMVNYTEALDIYKDLKLSAVDQALIILNILLIYLLMGKFEDFIEFCSIIDDVVIESMKNDPKFLFYNVVALYNLGRYNECMKYIEEFKIYNKSRIDKRMIHYYTFKINGRPTDKILGMLEKTYVALDRTGDYNYAKLALNLLIKEYEELGDYQKLYECTKRLEKLRF